MSPTTPWMKITALMYLVTIIKCMDQRDTAARNDRVFTSPQDNKLSIHTDRKKNLNDRNNNVPGNTQKFRTNFEEDQKIKMTNHNNQEHQDFNFKPENSFKCPPCVCKNFSTSLMKVLCEDVEFSDNVTQNLPFYIESIIVSSNYKVEVLDFSQFLMYSSLRYVKISVYRLVKVCKSYDMNTSSPLLELDLSKNFLSTVEESSFEVFPNLLKLSLNNNLLKNLTKQMFTGLSNLRSLLVSYNDIKFIANDTFDDMGNLVTLDISDNRVTYVGIDILLDRLLINLNNLEQLHINRVCTVCGAYPIKALVLLTNLKLLSIDGAQKEGLGPEIKGLRYLKNLIITDSWKDNLTNEFYFDNVPLITNLSTRLNINPRAFTRLKHLENLTLDKSHQNICLVLSDIQYLINSSLKYLTLHNINDRLCGCKELRAQDAKYLTLLNLLELDLSKNHIAYLSPEFIAMLPATLKKIDLSGNGLSDEIFYSFNKFPKELVELNLNNQENIYYPCPDEDAINSFHMTNGSEKISLKLRSLRNDRKQNNTEMIQVSNNFLPPKLRILRGDNFRRFGDNIMNFCEELSSSSLRVLSLAGGDFPSWASRQLMPLIEIATFINNYADFFNINFFPENNSLLYLTISNNLIGPAFQYDPHSLFFKNTKKLIALEMSRNFITALASDYFMSLEKLQILDISNNKFLMINISFAHMTEIRFLDFSTNAITSISKQSRDELDSIAANHLVYLDLTSNPLPCTCDGLELMKWMALTNVFLLNQDFLVCRNEFDQVLEIGNLEQRVEILQRQCASKTVITLTCVFSLMVFGILLITSLMYRYRWKLRYLRSIALVKLFGSKPADVKIVYRFDAYILYTDDTRRFVVRDCVRELEEKRGHRLCIEERDFLPGTYNLSNIVSGVQNSTKAVVMVTPEFYQGEYSEYCVKMALMEEIFMHRSVLFLCMYEPTDNKDLSHDLLSAMKQNNYIEFPPRDDVIDEMINEFWNQFSRAIGRSIREEI